MTVPADEPRLGRLRGPSEDLPEPGGTGRLCTPWGWPVAGARRGGQALSPTRARLPRSAELIWWFRRRRAWWCCAARPPAARVPAQGESLDGEDAGPCALPLCSSSPAGHAPAHRGKQGGLGLEGLQESRDRDPRWHVLPWSPIKTAQHPGPAPAFSLRPHFPGALSPAGPGRGLVWNPTSGGPLPTRRARRGICGGTAESPGPSGSGEGGLWWHWRGKS